MVIAALMAVALLYAHAQVMDINGQTGSSQAIVGDGTNIAVSSSGDTTTISLTGVVQPANGGLELI